MYCSVFSKAFSLFLCKGAIPSVVLSKKIAFSFSLSLSCRTFASMKIGNVEFGPYPVFLAPMEDVTDIGFRLLCKRFGAAMVYSEFVAADALVRMVNRSLEKLAVCDDERPVAIQIYGKEPGPVADAARIVVERARPDVLDLNFGCPVKRVAGKGAGAGMLQNIPKMLEITRAVVDAVDIPVTVKTRLGWDEGSKVIVDLAESLQDCGIRALPIHGGCRHGGACHLRPPMDFQGNHGCLESGKRVGCARSREERLSGDECGLEDRRAQGAGAHQRAPHRRIPGHPAQPPPSGRLTRVQGDS